MLTLNSLKLLKYCAQHDDFMYDTDSIKIDGLSDQEIRNACEALIDKNYFKELGRSILNNIRFSATYKGKEYKTYIKLSIWEFVAKSFLIPVIVALVTSIISTRNPQSLNITISNTITPSNAIEIRSFNN